MKTKTGLIVLCAVGLLSGCASPSGTGGDSNKLTIDLKNTPENLGGTANALLTGKGEKSELDIVVVGVPGWVKRPVELRIYIYPGRCGNLGVQPTYSLNELTMTMRVGGSWQMTKIIPATLAALRSGGYSVIVRTIPLDRNVDLFCGDIN